MAHSEDTQSARERAAALLRDAEETGVAIAPLSSQFPAFDVTDAYAVQRLNRDLRLAAGERVVGYKIGLTSLAMQQMLGVDTPDVGSVTDRMVIENGGTLDLGELIAGHIEAEFAFRIGTPLREAGVTVAALRAAISHVAVSAEIIDSRIENWEIGLVDTVADNASSARIVVGEWVDSSDVLLDALLECRITLSEDGTVIGEGPGAAVLGDPIEALRWLAEVLTEQGIALEPGDVVLAGSVHRMQPLVRARRYEVQAAGFGSAVVQTR